MARRVLESELWVPEAPETVFPFFADARNLEQLTPPWLRFGIESPMPVAMKKGALLDYRLRIRGFPVRWRTLIDVWQPPFRFVDVQLRGPYHLWHHTHTFEAADGGTLVRDRVVYEPPGGWLEPLVHKFLVQRDVASIFRYRADRMRARFGGVSEASARIEISVDRKVSPPPVLVAAL